MPATPVTLSFPTLTDTVVAFATVGAWNTYFANVNFTLTGDNLPDASGTSLGGVFAAANTAADATTWTPQSYTGGPTITAVDSGGVQNSVQVALQADLDRAVANIAQLKALYDSLIVALQASGAMQGA